MTTILLILLIVALYLPLTVARCLKDHPACKPGRRTP